ncbi:hypothetical protein ACHAW6_004915 [Cyclotella cf. meneghiniana]
MQRIAAARTNRSHISLFGRHLLHGADSHAERTRDITLTMSDQYDSIEKKFGISAYASPHEGFAAVVKARYSDFIVHEVDLNGNMACLGSLEVPEVISAPTDNNESSTNDRKRKLQATSDSPTESSNNVEDKVEEIAPVDWDYCKKECAKLFDETTAEELIAFLQSHTDESSPKEDDTKFYTLPLISDKQTRRSIHQLVKSTAMSSIARADNHEGKIRVWPIKYQADMPADTFAASNGGGKNNKNLKSNERGSRSGDRQAWPKDRPDFLRFVVYKENVDTSTALKDIVRIGRLNPKRGVAFAGMKDKRGVTSQFCSVYRVEKEQLLALNAHKAGAGGGNSIKGGHNIIRLGNFSYSPEEVKLGSLARNRFDIVLRNIDVGEDADDFVQKSNTIKQRLENAARALQQVGFINYFGMQRFGKSNDTHEVGMAILKGDYESALDIIMREKDTDELPRVIEARKKWANRFEGIDVTSNEDAARDAEMKCARSILNDFGRFLGVEKSVVGSLSRKPRDYKRAYTSIAKNMRSMYLHAYQSYLWNMVASHRIETGGSTKAKAGDVVLLEDKSLAQGGSGTSGLKGKVVKILDEDDVKSERYTIADIVLPLVGSKICYPKGPSGNKFDELLQKDGIKKADFAKIGTIDKEIALGGDYRKIICKPSDVSFEIMTYKEPLQPLIQTDLMKSMGTEITAAPISSSAKSPDCTDLTNQEVVTCDDSASTLFGMVIGFSLPPSSYATIALRELTKRPTSSEYQSKLELNGRVGKNERK